VKNPRAIANSSLNCFSVKHPTGKDYNSAKALNYRLEVIKIRITLSLEDKAVPEIKIVAIKFLKSCTFVGMNALTVGAV